MMGESGGNVDDMSLVAGLKNREAAAQEVFWQRYWDKLYPISAHILGSGPDAVDVLVDLLVEFMDERAETLTTPEALYAYLRMTTVRRAIRYRDRRGKQTMLSEQLTEESERTPEELASLSILMPRLDECLESLSPKAQQTLRLKFGTEITNERIGALVGGTKQYIGRLIGRSLETLRGCIDANGPLEGDP